MNKFSEVNGKNKSTVMKEILQEHPGWVYKQLVAEYCKRSGIENNGQMDLYGLISYAKRRLGMPSNRALKKAALGGLLNAQGPLSYGKKVMELVKEGLSLEQIETVLALVDEVGSLPDLREVIALIRQIQKMTVKCL